MCVRAFVCMRLYVRVSQGRGQITFNSNNYGSEHSSNFQELKNFRHARILIYNEFVHNKCSVF